MLGASRRLFSKGCPEAWLPLLGLLLKRAPWPPQPQSTTLAHPPRPVPSHRLPCCSNIGDGGNKEGPDKKYYPQPKYSAFREPSFGHGTLDLLDATHAGKAGGCSSSIKVPAWLILCWLRRQSPGWGSARPCAFSWRVCSIGPALWAATACPTWPSCRPEQPSCALWGCAGSRCALQHSPSPLPASVPRRVALAPQPGRRP